MNATANNVIDLHNEAQQSGERFTLRISAIAGTEATKESSTLWTGRQIGKQPRKDLQLSEALPQIKAYSLATLTESSPDFGVKIATIINDEYLAYIRRVKCQRMNIGDAIELLLPSDELEYAQLAVNMLSAPATRVKKLVSSSSIRAMLLSSEYRAAVTQAIAEPKRDAWKRIGEREMLPLAVAQDARVATARASVRDTVVIRCMEIAAFMPEGDNRLVLEAAAELLQDVPVGDLDDAI